MWTGMIEIAMCGQHLALDFFGKHRQAGKVMVAIAFDAGDSQGSADGEIGRKGHGADVGEVFATEYRGAAGMLAPRPDGERGAGDAVEHALAVLVARAGIT